MGAWRWHHDELHSLSEVGEGPAAEGEFFVQPEHCLSRLCEPVFEGVDAALHTHEVVEVAHGSEHPCLSERPEGFSCVRGKDVDDNLPGWSGGDAFFLAVLFVADVGLFGLAVLNL